MSQLPQDVEEFIAERAREVSYGRDSVMRDMRGNAVSVYDLRTWMTGHVRVPVELIEFIEAKEHHLPIEDRHVLSVMLNASKGE